VHEDTEILTLKLPNRFFRRGNYVHGIKGNEVSKIETIKINNKQLTCKIRPFCVLLLIYSRYHYWKILVVFYVQEENTKVDPAIFTTLSGIIFFICCP
jgi:hypothetical protein